MAFKHAHNFAISNLYAVDKRGEPNEFKKLQKAACLGAGHQSAERFDPPKCHPETRTAVIDDIMGWVDSKDPKNRILWLNGPAGAGKSAITQTITEICHKENKLISSFFFSRTAIGTGRNDGNRLVPTIACQLAISVPAAKSTIVSQLEKDAATLTYTMEVQMQKLVVEPLAEVIAQLGGRAELNNYTDTDSSIADFTLPHSNIPHLVVIDGLDECNGPEVQSMIVKVIARIAAPVHVRFLIASRPELEIRNAFNSPAVRKICTRVVLDDNYGPHRDIEIYLRSKFATIKREHTLASHLSRDLQWPSDGDINELVKRSSGQFIYASTVIKYIANELRDPRKRLREIINAPSGATSTESPYIELDTLYTYILSAAADRAGSYIPISHIFHVLLFALRERGDVININRSVTHLSCFFRMESTTVELLLADLHSIIFIPHEDDLANRSKTRIQFFHASFDDFLKDSSRSGDFFISEHNAHISLGHHCLANIREAKNGNLILMPVNPQDFAYEYSCRYFFTHLEDSKYDNELLYELRHVDVRSIFRKAARQWKDIGQFNIILERLFNFDFKIEGSPDFALTKVEEMQDICGHIYAAFNELLLERYQSYQLVDRVMPYYLAIASITRVRRYHSGVIQSSQNGLFYCWLATLLESPDRGKHLFLNGEICQLVFKHSWHLRHYFSADEESSIALSTILEYLLKRINPTTLNSDFGLFLQNCVGDGGNLESWKHHQSPEAHCLKTSIKDYLKECASLNEASSSTLKPIREDT